MQALCPELAIVNTMAAKQGGGTQVFWQGATAVPKRRRTENAYGDIANHVWTPSHHSSLGRDVLQQLILPGLAIENSLVLVWLIEKLPGFEQSNKNQGVLDGQIKENRLPVLLEFLIHLELQ